MVPLLVQDVLLIIIRVELFLVFTVIIIKNQTLQEQDVYGAPLEKSLRIQSQGVGVVLLENIQHPKFFQQVTPPRYIFIVWHVLQAHTPCCSLQPAQTVKLARRVILGQLAHVSHVPLETTQRVQGIVSAQRVPVGRTLQAQGAAGAHPATLAITQGQAVDRLLQFVLHVQQASSQGHL